MRTYTKRGGLVGTGLLTLAALVMGGCLPQRFVIDVTPAKRELAETVVLSDDGAGIGSAKFALISVSGFLADVEKPGLLGSGTNPVDEFVARLKRAADDKAVRGIVLRVNSPGGTVTGADIMYQELRRFRERTGKPVVVSMGEIATSGAYYLSLGADEIYAQPTSVTASIGVLMQTLNVSKGLSMIGVEARALTSGPNKDIANPLEPMEEGQYDILEGMVEEYYARFRGLVIERRTGLSPADAEWATDGRVMTGARAAEIGLVDGAGGIHAAFAAAKRLAGVEGMRGRLVAYHVSGDSPRSAYAVTGGDVSRGVMGAPGSGDGATINVIDVPWPRSLTLEPGFYYLWRP